LILSKRDHSAVRGAESIGDQRQARERCFIMVKAGSGISIAIQSIEFTLRLNQIDCNYNLMPYFRAESKISSFNPGHSQSGSVENPVADVHKYIVIVNIFGLPNSENERSTEFLP